MLCLVVIYSFLFSFSMGFETLNKIQRALFMLQRCYVLWLLLFANIAMYIAMCAASPSFVDAFFIGPSTKTLVLFGAKENGLIGLWQLERLFLPIFMHANLVHLTVNMVCLWSLGRIFEVIVGHKRLFFIYIISGIMGNLCSLAFLPTISVGASGSLFGILFCFYVIQKYEEKVTKKFRKDSGGASLGNIILLNAFLNLMFAFTYPIFDWASHLGGSIAGTLLGFALVTKHDWNLKIILYKTGFSTKEPHKTLRDEYRIFYVGILTIACLFFSSIFYVSKVQKIDGKAFLMAAENTTKPQSKENLQQFRPLLLEKNIEGNPQELLKGALYLHNQSHFFAATKIYEVLIFLFDAHMGNQEFLKTQTKKDLDALIKMAQMDEIPTAEIVDELQKNISLALIAQSQKTISSILQFTTVDEICAKPAQLFMSLGFFQISGDLYTCAFSLDHTKTLYATRALSSFAIENDSVGKSQVNSLIQVYQDAIAL